MDSEQTIVVTVGGLQLNGNIKRSAPGGIIQTPVTLPAGVAGTLSTRTDDDTGVCTIVGHALSVSDKVDVYWDAALRYGMNVSAVNGDDVTVDLGAGTVLPTQDAAVVVTKRVLVNEDFDGDELVMIAAQCDKRAHLEFTTGGDANILSQELAAAQVWSWTDNQNIVNPLAGSVVGKIQASCGETAAGVLKILGLLSSVS